MKPSSLTADDLEEMRRVAIEHYQLEPHEMVDAFLPELRRGAVMFDDGIPRVGLWRAEEHGGRLVLVRTPPLHRLMVFFGLAFEKRAGAWVVVEEYERIDEMLLPDDEES